MKNHEYTLCLIDDEPSMLKALSASLTEIRGLKILTFTSARDCIKRISSISPDLVISDVNMPGMDGMSFLREAHRIDPCLDVVLITGYGDIPTAVEAVKAGAREFIEKPLDLEQFISLVQGILLDKQQKTSALTRAESEVLKKVASGMTNKQIAYQMRRSVRTVENHRHRIMRKLNIASTAEMVKAAIELGLTGVDINIRFEDK